MTDNPRINFFRKYFGWIENNKLCVKKPAWIPLTQEEEGLRKFYKLRKRTNTSEIYVGDYKDDGTIINNLYNAGYLNDLDFQRTEINLEDIYLEQDKDKLKKVFEKNGRRTPKGIFLEKIDLPELDILRFGNRNQIGISLIGEKYINLWEQTVKEEEKVLVEYGNLIREEIERDGSITENSFNLKEPLDENLKDIRRYGRKYGDIIQFKSPNVSQFIDVMVEKGIFDDRFLLKHGLYSKISDEKFEEMANVISEHGKIKEISINKENAPDWMIVNFERESGKVDAPVLLSEKTLNKIRPRLKKRGDKLGYN